jgi:hypothetical protein
MFKIDTISDQLQSTEKEVVYNADNIYWCFIDDHNTIHGIFGFKIPVSGLSDNLGKPVCIGKLNESAYRILHSCLYSKGAVCYLEKENEEFKYYRLVVTTSDDIENCKGKIDINVKCLDEDDQPVAMTSIKVINNKLPQSGGRPKRCKITEKDENNYTIEFLGKGDYSLKVIAYHGDNKLKCYIQCNNS